MDVRVEGAEDLAKLGRALRSVDKEFKRDLFREIRGAAKPAGEAIRDAYGAKMPRRGGLAERLRKSSVSAKTRLSGQSVGVQVTLRNRHSLNSIERGRLRHPVFGNQDVWVDQQVPANVGADALDGRTSDIQRRVHAAMEKTADRILRS